MEIRNATQSHDIHQCNGLLRHNPTGQEDLNKTGTYKRVVLNFFESKLDSCL